MRKRPIGFLITLLLSLHLISAVALSASNKQSGEVTGTWEGSYQGHQFLLVLNADGTMTLNNISGTYTYLSGRLTVNLAGQTIAYIARISGDALWISGGDLQGATIQFSRRRAGIFGQRQPGERMPPAERGQAFDIYTLNQDDSVRIGYPRGWVVQEHEAGVSILERTAPGSAGIEIFIGSFKGGYTTSEALARSMLNSLRQSFFPDLTVLGQAPHPQAPQILTLDVGFSSGGLPFLSRVWTVADQATSTGMFLAFYAPRDRYQYFDAERILINCLAPVFGGAQSAVTSAPGPGGELVTSRLPGSGGGPILFLRQMGEARIICSLDPASGRVTPGRNARMIELVQPAYSRAGNRLVFPVRNFEDGSMLTGFGLNLDKDYSFRIPGVRTAIIAHPTISRDGRLIAVKATQMMHAGNMDVYDDSGAYDHTYMAVGSSIRIVAVDTASGQQRAVYFENSLVGPSEGQAWHPAFSPTQDVLAYADNQGINICDALSGRLLNRIPVPEKFSALENSGLTFAPNGSAVAFLTRTTYQAESDWSAIYAVVTVNVGNGALRHYYLPETVRPYSPAEFGQGAVCIDFSPDGRFIVFTATPKEAGEWWGYDMIESLEPEDEASPCDLYVIDVNTGICYQITNDGASFDPVWKGR